MRNQEGKNYLFKENKLIKENKGLHSSEPNKEIGKNLLNWQPMPIINKPSSNHIEKYYLL